MYLHWNDFSFGFKPSFTFQLKERLKITYDQYIHVVQSPLHSASSDGIQDHVTQHRAASGVSPARLDFRFRFNVVCIIILISITLWISPGPDSSSRWRIYNITVKLVSDTYYQPNQPQNKKYIAKYVSLKYKFYLSTEVWRPKIL